MKSVFALAAFFAFAGCDFPDERKARRALDGVLLDADSAKFKGVSRGPRGAICGQVNSKNGFGAMGGWKFFFTDDNGYTARHQDEASDSDLSFFHDHSCACYSQEFREKYDEPDAKACPGDKPAKRKRPVKAAAP